VAQPTGLKQWRVSDKIEKKAVTQKKKKKKKDGDS